jgi:surfeit locus 1 family protein
MTRHLVLFTLFMAAGLALLIGLGVWQLQRLEWKEGLIAKIEARVHAPPVTLKEAVASARAGEDISYLRVKTEGRFDHSKERYVYAVTDEGVGWHVITPLVTPDGAVVLIDRGIVPDQLKDPATRPQGEIEGTVTVTGLARQPESQGRFTPDNEPEQNRWFWRDLGGLTRSMFPGAQPEVAPFIVEAEKSDVPGGWPRGGATRLDIPNDHLQYAITWFLLAFCLVIIYAVYVRSRLRPPASPVAGPGSDR